MSKYKNRSNDCEDLHYFEQNPPSELISKIETDINRGITSTENRELHFGSNKIFSEPPPKFLKYVFQALKNLMVIILIIAAIVSIVLGTLLLKDYDNDWIEGVSIIIAIIIVVLVSSITEYNKELKFHKLNKTTREGTKYKVIRK